MFDALFPAMSAMEIVLAEFQSDESSRHTLRQHDALKGLSDALGALRYCLK